MTKNYKVLRKESLTWKGRSILIEIRMKPKFPYGTDFYVFMDNEIISHTSNTEAIEMIWEDVKGRRSIPEDETYKLHKELEKLKTNDYFTHEGARIPIKVELHFQEIIIPKNFSELLEKMRNILSTVQNKKNFCPSFYDSGYSYFTVTINGEKHIIGKKEAERKSSCAVLVGGLFFFTMGIFIFQKGIREGEFLAPSIFSLIFGLLCILGSNIKFRKPKK